MMKRNSLSIVLCLLSFGAVAAPFAADVTCERYPDADAVTVDEIERVRYNPDGTYEQTDECWTKLLTEKGRREESSFSLDYSKRYGTAAIVFVKAIGTNGVERTIDVSATTKESTDNGSMSSNIYDPLDRKIVCTIPGLRIGETLHVKTMRKATKPRCKDKWADLSVMEWSHPIVKSTYEVTAPAERPLRKIAIRHPLGNVVTNVTKLADGSLVHTFTATNSAQVFPEPDMPPLYTQIQNVRVSTAESWPEISKWYWDLCAPHIAKTNAAMLAKVSELTRSEVGGQRSEKQLRAIFKFVSQEVRYMGLTEEDTSPGYAPHDADRTFDSRAGVCRDKAGLLVAMLRLAGFKAFPVLIHVGAKLDPEVPQPFFNHAIVAVEEKVERRGGGGQWKEDSSVHLGPSPSPNYLLMDPTNENTKDLFPSYLGNCSYLVARPEGEMLMTSPVTSPGENGLDVSSRGRLMQDGTISLVSQLSFAGINDTAYRGALVRRKPADRTKFFEKVVKSVSPGAELVACEIEPADLRDTEKPIAVKLVTRFPESVLHGKTRSELNVPFFGKALGIVNFLLTGNTSLETRRFPLVLDTTAQVSEEIALDLSTAALGKPLELPNQGRTGLRVGRGRDQMEEELAKPSSWCGETPHLRRGGVLASPVERGTASGSEFLRSFVVSNGTLFARRVQTVGAVEFSPAEYAALREAIKGTEAAERKRPVFAEDPLAEADVRILLEKSETTVASDVAWTTTNTVIKQILTYEGKKRSAELKFGFNPVVEGFDLVSAVVSNADGKVSTVTAKERNVMDCGWAAAAPRYPAGKLLVVNLPAVEIGSVIAYTTVRTVTNAPASFYATYAFDAHEPLERKVVRVNDWRREVTNPRRLPNEPNQPAASFWRDQVIVSLNDFAKQAVSLRPAVDIPAIRRFDDSTIRQFRDWMSKYVKIVGPGLYELPLDRQLTDPEVVLRERYATRLDYVRTLCALLRGAGYEADVVFAASDANEPAAIRRRIMFEKPNVRAFAAALCRVTVRTGGFLGFGGEKKTYFIGTENQYAPLGPSAYEGCDYFDPERGTFGVVTVPSEAFSDCESEKSEYCIRADGAVDLTVESRIWGTGVGAFRKSYSEILPEERSRRYQAILGSIAQAASATSELETDVESYPAVRKFSCYIPDFATVQGDALTIQVPALVCDIPSCVGTARQTPFAVAAADREMETVTIRFPEGYTELECLPKAFVFADPLNPSETWMESAVTAEVKDGALTVVLSRIIHKRPSLWYGSSFYELMKDWFRIANARASRTVTVRKSGR